MLTKKMHHYNWLLQHDAQKVHKNAKHEKWKKVRKLAGAGQEEGASYLWDWLLQHDTQKVYKNAKHEKKVQKLAGAGQEEGASYLWDQHAPPCPHLITHRL